MNPSARADFIPSPRDGDLPSVVESFRHFPVTLVYGQPGNGTTTLLKTRVLPVLGRRSSDRKLAQDVPRDPPPSRERREPHDDGPEIAIYCDSWNELTLETLRTRVASALIMRGAHIDAPLPSLADGVVEWSTSLRARLLFVLDRFEHCVAAAPERAGVQAFVDELVRMANEPRGCAHFLIAVPEYAEPLLEPLAERIEGFGAHTMVLPHEEPVEAPLEPPPAVAFARAVNSAMPKPDARSDAGGVDGNAMAGSDQQAAALAQALRDAHLFEAGTRDVPEAAAAVEPAPTPDAPDAEPPFCEAAMDDGAAAEDAEAAAQWVPPAAAPAPPPSVPHASLPRRPDRLSHIAVTAATVVGASLVAWVWWMSHASPDEPAPAQATDVPVPRAAASAAPAAPVVVFAPDARHVRMAVDAGTNAALASELQRALAPGLALDFEAAPDAAIRAPAQQASVAIVTFETIRPPPSVRAPAGSARDPFVIIAPLYTEEIHVVTRRDSPLTYLHELKGARVNFGPPGTGRRATATRLYARMFGAAVPDDVGVLDDAEALRRLLVDRSLDAVVVVEAQPARRLVTLEPQMARALKLLALDRAHPTAQAAIEDYLPAKLQAASYPAFIAHDTQSLATMAFLVAARPADAQAADDLVAVARGLCQALPMLQRAGDAKWREVQPLLKLDGGWQPWPPGEAVFRSCRNDPAGRVVATSPFTTQIGAAR